MLDHLLDQRENAFSTVRLFRPCRFDGFFYTTLSSYPPTLKEDIANDQNKCICPLHLSSWMVIIDIGDVFIFREQRVVISIVSRGKKNNNYIAERNRCHKRTKTLAPFNFVFQYIQSQTESFIVLLIIHRKLIINDT